MASYFGDGGSNTWFGGSGGVRVDLSAGAGISVGNAPNYTIAVTPPCPDGNQGSINLSQGDIGFGNAPHFIAFSSAFGGTISNATQFTTGAAGINFTGNSGGMFMNGAGSLSISGIFTGDGSGLSNISVSFATNASNASNANTAGFATNASNASNANTATTATQAVVLSNAYISLGSSGTLGNGQSQDWALTGLSSSNGLFHVQVQCGNPLRSFSAMVLSTAGGTALQATAQPNWQDTQRVFLDSANNVWFRVGDGATSNAAILRVINQTNGGGDVFTAQVFRLTNN